MRRRGREATIEKSRKIRIFGQSSARKSRQSVRRLEPLCDGTFQPWEMGTADLQRRRTVSARPPPPPPLLSSSSTTTAPSPPTRPPPSRPSSTPIYSSLNSNGPHQGQHSHFPNIVECIVLIVIAVVVQQTARKSTGGECRYRANYHNQ